ncbi:APC family permease [Pseudonocardia alaniniphila]|uniref:APC family permease n=1 Tax=Pseudonocardia alaniniphila TaxID=75291 RepID=A0ABS9TVC3_9PSEU|nr:APC family permease [Pseudonocardia alaniniphila]MCH6172456.1 APC family permease [Pseudonocardia alaniniphila]
MTQVAAGLRRVRPVRPIAEERHRLTATTGIAALGLDALASCAYGPESIVLALGVAGAAGIGLTVPVTLVIVGLLAVLVVCYRQVIAAYPDGGGAYTVARDNLGRRAGLVAAASLVVDYVLNVAVSVAAGVAALTSAFPELLPWTVELCIAVLILVTGVNLRGVVTGGKLFALPALVFVGSLVVLIVVGLVRGGPMAPLPPADPVITPQAVGILLVLAALANGCSALTGVEAIANATPSFRTPGRARARRAEAGLGLILGTLLIGLAVLVEMFHAGPVTGRTLLSLLAEGSIGTGTLYVVVQLATVVLLGLAANTSFGGLPVLAARLAADGALPHVFGLRGDRQVYRASIVVLAVLSGALLLFSAGQVAVLVPLFAIGVFVGFSLCQAGMLRHWWTQRGPRWQQKAALSVLGVTLTGAAAIVLTAEKFTAGAWLIVLVIPLLVLLFVGVRRSYARIGHVLEVDQCPQPPRPTASVVVVPVVGISRLAEESLSAALSMGSRTVAVHVVLGEESEDRAQADAFQDRWQEWRPDVPLVLLTAVDERGRPSRVLGPAIARYLRSVSEPAGERALLLVGEVAPDHWWQRVLFNRRGAVVARYAERHTDAVVCRLRFRLLPRRHGEPAHTATQNRTLVPTQTV